MVFLQKKNLPNKNKNYCRVERGIRLIIERLKLFLPTKKEIIYYCAFALIVISGFLLWFFMFRVDESELRDIETRITNDEEINSYFSIPSISRDDLGEVVKYKSLKSYPYKLIASFNDDFNKLTEIEKQDVFNKVVEVIEQKEYDTTITCGRNKFCSIDEIWVFGSDSKKDTISYMFNLSTDEIKYSFYDENDEYQTEILSSTDTKSNNSKTASSTISNKSELEVVEKKGEINGDYITVTGAIKNNSDTAFTFVEIKVTYTDDNGNILDTDTTYLNSSDAFLPNERKSFEVMTQMIGEKYTKYKVEVADYNIGY
jgi:hypothetical protein